MLPLPLSPPSLADTSLNQSCLGHFFTTHWCQPCLASSFKVTFSRISSHFKVFCLRDVGNVRNQSMELTKKVEEGEQVPEKKLKTTGSSSASKGLMANWLKRGKAKTGEDATFKRLKDD